MVTASVKAAQLAQFSTPSPFQFYVIFLQYLSFFRHSTYKKAEDVVARVVARVAVASLNSYVLIV